MPIEHESPEPSPASSQHCPAASQDVAIVELSYLPLPSSATSDASLPANFDAVAVVRCEVEVQTFAGDGQWSVELGQRASSGLGPLLAALRLPSSPPAGPQVACAAVGVEVPDFALVDADEHILVPDLPVDECGAPLTAALDALNALHWTTETEQKITHLQTEPEVETGCPPEFKDLFELESGSTQPYTTSVRPTVACEYTVAPSGQVQNDVGQFSRGAKLTDSQQSAITVALRDAGTAAAKSCTTRATKFALLLDGSMYVVIELNGCQRMDYPNEFRAATPTALLNDLSVVGIS